jgi:parallel beta-helix repeat protein
MEGLMLNRSDSLLVWNNTIEYNSGVGIGLYRSSYNRIMHNRASYNVRGYSKFYRRGQDSADLLMYEQSSNNIVAYNMMTHGGDGLFLWAGQSTMDTGQGGANDNIFYANDFSYAPANAIEATFSRNTFVANNASGSDYGMWGGYSFDSRIEGNRFSDNRTGIAIEHGQNNRIVSNAISFSITGINIWANRIEPSDWGYPKFRDTRSTGYEIANNRLFGVRAGVRASNTKDTRVAGNHFTATDTSIVQVDSSQLTVADNTVRPRQEGEVAYVDVGTCPQNPLVARLPRALPNQTDCVTGARDGRPNDMDARAVFPRDAIIVDEWGPYDYRYPRLWPVDSTAATPMRLVVLGPDGSWRVKSMSNVASTSRRTGSTSGSSRLQATGMPGEDTITVRPTAGHDRDWSIILEFTGRNTVTDARGRKYRAGSPYTFRFERFDPITEWSISFFAWPDSVNPRNDLSAFGPLFSRSIQGTPLLTRREARLDYMFYGAGVKGVPQDRWAAVATTTVTLPPGSYTLRALSDDGARVFVDGKLAIDSWAPHETQVGNAPITAGRHDIRVEYYQIDGWSELRVDIVKGLQKSTGSPGPH